jgi:biopolymer transport protein ExbD
MPVERRVFRRRRLSLTSLIDVIFLMLLFFMLSSTFARHGELPLVAGGAGVPADGPPPLFLRLAADGLTLNGAPLDVAGLPAELAGRAQEGGLRVIVALAGPVTSQALADTLSALRKVPEAAVTVID